MQALLYIMYISIIFICKSLWSFTQIYCQLLILSYSRVVKESRLQVFMNVVSYFQNLLLRNSIFLKRVFQYCQTTEKKRTTFLDFFSLPGKLSSYLPSIFASLWVMTSTGLEITLIYKHILYSILWTILYNGILNIELSIHYSL